ncbi:putative ABC-type ATPase [Neorhizobium galegae]|nr:putative ABC-type ATPase [Neorhizobium galegae]
MVLGGPNGAGKTSLYRRLQLPGQFVNADEVAKTIDAHRPESASLEAGRRVLDTIDRLLAGREDFAYETTLSSRQSVNLLRRAQKIGYRTLLVFIALESADLHVLRVAQRVRMGGHAIPEEAIRRRYEATFRNLGEVAGVCDAVSVYDNSSAEGYRLVLELAAGTIATNSLSRTRPFDSRIAACVAPALSMRAEDLLVG